jgi:hypothetical protein
MGRQEVVATAAKVVEYPAQYAIWGHFWGKRAVALLIVYLVLMIVGDLVAYSIGWFIEFYYSSAVSLPAFLALYFLFLWVAWIIAVRVTAPSAKASAAA